MSRRFLLFCAIAWIAVTAPSYGYVLTGAKWETNSVTFSLQLGEAPLVLLDGNISFDQVAVDAMDEWSGYLLNLQLIGATAAPGVGGWQNGINEIFFADKVYDIMDFGPSVLAVAIWRPAQGTLLESDIIFNTAFTWDSFRGRYNNGTGRIDLRRVLLHEMGHSIGLGHPDEDGQTVVSLMNSTASNLDALQPDDIAGGRFLYGDSGTPLPTPTPRPPVVSTVPRGDSVPQASDDQLRKLRQQYVNARRIRNPTVRAKQMSRIQARIRALQAVRSGQGDGGMVKSAQLADLRRQMADAKRATNSAARAERLVSLMDRIREIQWKNY